MMAFDVKSLVIGALVASAGVVLVEQSAGIHVIPGVPTGVPVQQGRTQTDNDLGGSAKCPDCGVKSFDFQQRGVLVQTKCEKVRVCTLSADNKDLQCGEWR